MKKAVRIMSLLLTAVMLLSFAGCGKDSEKTVDMGRILFNSGVDEYIELGKYKGLTVDKTSDGYIECFNDELFYDAEQNSLYNTLSEGTVQDGDVANIDYTGKKDGVAFDGGTDTGYDLTIGSGQFIPGFEDGLIGVAMGATTDLELTFPEEYQSEDLAGQDVVFTVTVNSIKRPKQPAETYSQLGYESEQAYVSELEDRAVKNYILQTIAADSKIKKYSETDINTILDATLAQQEMVLQQQYGVDMETYISYMGQTMDSYKETLIEYQVKPVLDDLVILYAVMDDAKIKLTDDMIQEKIDYAIGLQTSEVTEEDVKKYYGEYTFETAAVQDAVIEYLLENTKIK